MIVRECMTPKVFSIRFDKKLIAVREIMTWAHVRHVPVVDASGALVGLISHRDLLSAAISSVAPAPEVERARHLAEVPIVKVMQMDIQTIGPDAPVREAASRMRRHKIGCLPVVESRKLVGILTGFDLVGILEKQ
ncbi:MAG TPA: CBS domain-containing protein [Gemmatimonadales bacterium]|nr:CBS domain-containing protein [Gemmatimonadales bacterium]